MARTIDAKGVASGKSPPAARHTARIDGSAAATITDR
jgi:hypothetical protein